jgi:hypothetical protein
VDVTRFIIGISPVEEMRTCVKNLSEKNIIPDVAKVGEAEGNLRNSSMEFYTELIIRESVKKRIGRIERTNEGCADDMIFTVFDMSETFLSLQMKTTHIRNAKKGTWEFGGIKNYDGKLLILHAISVAKTWMIPYNTFRKNYKTHSVGIGSGAKKTLIKWSDYEVNINDIGLYLHYYYANMEIHGLNPVRREVALTPRSLESQTEISNRTRIISSVYRHLGEVTFPDLQNALPFDLSIGTIKVQEKTSYKSTIMTFIS